MVSKPSMAQWGLGRGQGGWAEQGRRAHARERSKIPVEDVAMGQSGGWASKCWQGSKVADGRGRRSQSRHLDEWSLQAGDETRHGLSIGCVLSLTLDGGDGRRRTAGSLGLSTRCGNGRATCDHVNGHQSRYSTHTNLTEAAAESPWGAIMGENGQPFVAGPNVL